MSTLFRKKGEQFFDNDGLPLLNGYLIYFDAGTSDTATVYTDPDLSNAHPEEIELDASGRLPHPVYLTTGDVKEILYREDGSQVFSQDDYPGDPGSQQGSASFALPKTLYASDSSISASSNARLLEAAPVSGTTITLTLPLAGTAGDGWAAVVRCAGAGTVRVVRAGSNLINGQTEFSISGFGSWAVLTCDGAAWSAMPGASSPSISRRNFSVIDRDLSAPPGSPAVGNTYIVGTSPSGAWSGQAGNIAYWGGQSWQFIARQTGMLAWLEDEGFLVTWNGSAWRRPDVGPAGAVLQHVATSYATYSSHTTAIPEDDTIPVQASEGDQILSLSITLEDATNVVRGVAFVPALGATSGNKTIVAVFRGSTCVGAAIAKTEAIETPIAIHFVDSPGSASALTYTVRVGTNGTGTTYVNGNASARRLGGAMKASLEVWEVAA